MLPRYISENSMGCWHVILFVKGGAGLSPHVVPWFCIENPQCNGYITWKWYFWISLAIPLLLNEGRAVVQAVSCWVPTAAARVRVRAACGVCGGQSVTGAGFLRVLRFPLPIISPVSPSSESPGAGTIGLWVAAVRSGPSWTSPPTIPIKKYYLMWTFLSLLGLEGLASGGLAGGHQPLVKNILPPSSGWKWSWRHCFSELLVSPTRLHVVHLPNYMVS
jgi:hypothetical protein